MNITVAQVPFNLYDQRFMNSKILSKVISSGAEIHVRSAFLQGLLLMEPEDLPSYFYNIYRHHSELYKYAMDMDISVYELCLSWVVKQPWINRIVCGITSVAQSKKMINTINKNLKETLPDIDQFSVTDLKVINPAAWS